MKQLISLFAFLLTVACLVACTADYDEFEESHYKVLKNIVFAEQSGSASIYSEEHIIKVTTVAPPESLETWDSLTIDTLDISNLATLHLVDGKFKEFPSDSAALDSLAEEVSYVDSKLQVGDKIRIPKSLVVYVMLVAENGDPAIWKIDVTIPGVEKDDDGSKSSSSVKSDAKSSSSAKAESSSSVALNDETDLQLTFKNQLKVNRSGDTITIKLTSDQKIEDATVDTYKVSDGATASPDPEDVEDWSKAQEIVVTAEDGKTKQTWVVIVDVAAADEKASSDKELVSISAANQVADADIDADKKTVVIHLDKQKELRAVELTVEVSETASQNLKSGTLDLSEPVTMTITAEDGSTAEWTISADYRNASLPPRITAMKIAGNDAVIDSVEEDGQMVYWVHYDNLEFLSDLTSLEVSDIELTEGSTIEGVEDGSTYDLSYGQKVSVTNDGQTVEYEIRAGYQYPNSDFKTWSSNKPSSWDNGNQTGIVSVTITSSTSSGSDYAVYMQTKTAPVVKTLASGNLFIGTMNPKGVAAMSMLNYKDGNELIDFGKPFYARPRYMELDIQYTGKNDSCDVYLILENRTSTATCTNGSTVGSNVCRTSSDVNTLVASAWFRATSDDDASDPDVVSISEPNSETGLRTLRMKLKYGEPYDASPIMNIGSTTGTVSTLYDGGLVNSSGIDNHLVVGDGTQPVTHIRAVFAASADGNHYSGVEGAVFIVDNFRLIY